MAYRPTPAIGARDSNYKMCSAQDIPVDGADDYSLSWIDLVDTAPNMRGAGEMILKVEVTTKISVASGTTAQMYINLATLASDATPTTELQKAIVTLQYNTADGTILEGALPPRASVNYLRYIGLVLEPVSDNTLFSAGAITAWIEWR